MKKKNIVYKDKDGKMVYCLKKIKLYISQRVLHNN